MLAGHLCSNIGRLNADGTFDPSFVSFSCGVLCGANDSVSSLVVQADGKILVGGLFTTFGGSSRAYIGRLNADGTVDNTLNLGANGPVHSLVVQADGRILAGGFFTSLGGQSRSHIGRLNADGSLDTNFNPGVNPEANSSVYSLAVQADGKILVGGSFTVLGGQNRSCIGRLTATGPATQSLTFNGSTVIWLRGGNSPEVLRTFFEASTNGKDWLTLGSGSRIAGGWQLTGLAWPTNANVRARGFIAGGAHNGCSTWYVETIIGPPVVVTQPTSQTVILTSNATFSVSVGGTQPLNLQWQKGGSSIAGATNTSLVLNTVNTNDAGLYSIVVSNTFGKVTSSNVTLTVLSHPPVVNPDAFSTASNAPVSFAAAKLLVNDTDPDGFPLAVTSVSARSIAGGAATLSSGQVTYSPPIGFVGNDFFFYNVSDGQGGVAGSTVTVTVGSGGLISLNLVFGPVVDGSNFVVRFSGIPGFTYTIEAASALGGPWVKVSNLTAPATDHGLGVGIFEFSEPVGTNTARFYRTIFPSY